MTRDSLASVLSLMKFLTDVASVGGTKALYETVEGIPFAKLKSERTE